MGRTMARRHRRWLSGDFPPSSALSLSLSHAARPFSSSTPAAPLFPQSTVLRKGMAVHSLTEGNRRRAERASEHGGRKTLLGLLLSVGMKDRSYLQATVANGRNGERVESSADGWNIKGTNPSNRPVGPGNDSLLSIRSPICAIFIPVRRCEGGCILGIHSGVLVERFSLVTRFVGDIQRDKMKIGSAHLMEQMVECFRIYRRTFRSISIHQYICALKSYSCRVFVE